MRCVWCVGPSVLWAVRAAAAHAFLADQEGGKRVLTCWSSTWPPAKLESILAAARLGAGNVSESSLRRGTARDDNGFATMLTTSRRSDADMDAQICSDGGPGHLRRAGEHRERHMGAYGMHIQSCRVRTVASFVTRGLRMSLRLKCNALEPNLAQDCGRLLEEGMSRD